MIAFSWRREAAAITAFFAVVAVAATYPLIRRAAFALPAGLGDPALVTFLLAWDADRIAHGFHNFWEPPFLFPHRHTLAYSEHMLGVAVFTAPLQWLTRNPVLVYNVAFLGSYVLAGVGAYVLTRSLWGRRDAAVLAGLAFALCPYRLGHVMHLQMLMAGWMPVALWALHRYLASWSRRALAGFAVTFLLLSLSNAYYLFFFSLAVAVVIGVELIIRPRVRLRRLLPELAGAGAVIGVVLAPFAWMYLRVQRENALYRGADEFINYSARLSDYLTVPEGVWNWRGLLHNGAPERQLYLGFFAMSFAILGLITAATANEDLELRGRRLRLVITYTLVTLMALWVSLGPGAWRPYGLLFRFMPGFSGMRVPARIATVVDLGLVVLASAGAAWLFGRLRRRTALIVAITIGTLVIVEGRQKMSIDPFPPVQRRLDRETYEWLRDQPPGAVVELRMAQQNDVHSFTLFYQFNTLFHRHPIVNGYSAWPSLLQEFLGGPAAPFGDATRLPDTLRALRATGVRYLLLHWWTYKDANEAARTLWAIRTASDQIVEERQFKSTFAWRLAAAAPPARTAATAPVRIDPGAFTAAASHMPDRLPLLVDGDIETGWITGTQQAGAEWLELRLRKPRDVSRVRIEMSPRALVDYPRRLVLESVDARGTSRVLFNGTVLQRLIESLTIDDRRARIDIDLAPNTTAILRLRQTGETRWFWSVHELSLWERQ
jgi:hypothetical protein